MGTIDMDTRCAIHRGHVIPKNGRWMDPNALYRGKLPLDTASMKALPDVEKQVPVPVMQEDGTTIPLWARSSSGPTPASGIRRRRTAG